MNIVANNVRRILDETDMKHKRAAELCGYSQKTFSAMLNGRKVIKVEDVIAFCKGLEVEPNELYRTTSPEDESA